MVTSKNNKKVYFSGDTGYCDTFKEIGHVFGPIDVGLIAIGAYCPRNFMKPQHVNPEEAVQMHLDIKSKISFGIHWGNFHVLFCNSFPGTFILTNEPQDEPPKLIKEELQKRNLKPNEFITSHIGETWTFSNIFNNDNLKDKSEQN